MDGRKTSASSDLREQWILRGLSFEEAAHMLASTLQPNGTFVVTMGPAPQAHCTVSVVLDKTVRQIAVLPRLPRGLQAYNPVTGKLEEFTIAKEFICNNRSIFRYNFSQVNVPLMEFDMKWSKEYLFLESPVTETGGGELRLDDGDKNMLFGLVVSSYPESDGGWSRICDHVAARVFPNRYLLTLADGCGFGHSSRAAAIAASHSFLEFMCSYQFRAPNSEVLAKGLLRSVQMAHDKVLESSSTVPEDAGTTTLLGGAVVKLDDSEPDRWGLVLVNVGDVKCFVWRKNRMIEATLGNRGNTNDATDPGGRIGPRLEKLLPDLRNLRCYYVPLEVDDIVVLMSDGVHDNFDPQSNGNIAPSLISDSIPSGTEWKDMNPLQAMLLKSQWACDFMARMLSPIENLTPEVLCRTLADFCLKNTESSRNFMDQNPNKRLPSDYTKFPGKMDHTSLLAVRVADVVNIKESDVTDVASFEPDLLGKFLSQPDSPAQSPPLSPVSSPPFSHRHNIPDAVRKRVSDAGELERFRLELEQHGTLKGLRFLGLALALIEYNQLTSDEERRAKADIIIQEHFYDSSVVLHDDRVSFQGKNVVRAYAKLTGSKASARTHKSQLNTLFDKVFPRVMSVLVPLCTDPTADGAASAAASANASTNSGTLSFKLGSSPNSRNSQFRSFGGRIRKMMTSSETLPNLGPPPDQTATFDDMLKNSELRLKVLELGTALGYETGLRFVVLERDYRREGMERRLDFAKQIYSHFVSPLAPSPVKIALEVRRAIGRALDDGKSPLDLFEKAINEVLAQLNNEFYPQLLCNDQFMMSCSTHFAADKLNQDFREAVSRGDDKLALNCLEGGADVNFVDPQGYSPLLNAAYQGHYKLCLELLKKGAYVNQETHDQTNIWHILAAGPQGLENVIPFTWNPDLRILMRKLHEIAITRPSSGNLFKETALHVAVLSKAPFELIRFLCDKNPGLLECKNASGETACRYASRMGATQELLLYLDGHDV